VNQSEIEVRRLTGRRIQCISTSVHERITLTSPSALIDDHVSDTTEDNGSGFNKYN
jgi:hypothetical protein